MGRVRVRIETDIVTATIGPGNFGTDFDSDVGWLETVRGGSDGVLADSLGRVIGGAIGHFAFLGEVEVIDRGINQAANHEIDNEPLPEGAGVIVTFLSRFRICHSLT